MASTPSSSVPMAVITTTGISSSPAKKASPCLSQVVRVMQMGCLIVIPIFTVSLIFFLAIFAVKCDGSSGFVISESGTVNCVSTMRGMVMLGREGHQDAVDADVSTSGRVVMTVTRVVLISVSALIVSFTAWICVWYQMYGKTDTASQPELPVHASGSGAMDVPFHPVLSIRVDDFLSKEDMERLLGPDHSAAPAV